MAIFDVVDRGLLGYGGMLEVASRCLFDGEDLEDCPLLCPFMVPIAVCLMLVPLDCRGFMTDSSVLGNEMGMRVGFEEILGLKHFWSRLGEGLR